MEKIVEIKKQLQEALDAYDNGNPIMSDREYDELEKQLRILNPQDEWFSKGVQSKAPESRDMRLPFKMMSLDKIKTFAELCSWFDKMKKRLPGLSDSEINIVITPKFDGISAFQGVGEKMITRGDGITGRDFSANHYLRSSLASFLDVRGELIMTWDDWKVYKEAHPEASNPRNAVAGLVNGDFDESKAEDYKRISFMPYNIYGDRYKEGTEGFSKIEILANLDSMYYVSDSIDNITEEALDKLYSNWKSNYPIDGLVIDIDDPKARYGENPNGNPQYQIAYKPSKYSPSEITRIVEIKRNMNRRGVITPIVNFDTIDLEGAQVSNANGINMRYILDWRLYPGESIEVARSGGVIPKIVKAGNVRIPFKEEFSSAKAYKDAYEEALIERARDYAYNHTKPANADEYFKCPFCGTGMNWDDNKMNLMCHEPSCKEQYIQHIIEFFRIMGLENWKEKTFRQIYEETGVEIVMDILNLKYVKGTKILTDLPGWTLKSAKKFFDDIDALTLKPIPLERFCHALGSFGDLGEKTIGMILRNLPDHYTDFGTMKYPEEIKEENLEDLTRIDGVGEATARDFRLGWSRICHMKRTTSSLLGRFNIDYSSCKPNGGFFTASNAPLADIKAVMTGFRDRNLEETIEDGGGKVLSSVSKNASHLVVAGKNTESSKAEKARKLGIPVVSREEFNQIIDELLIKAGI